MSASSAIQEAFFDYVFGEDEGYVCIATQEPGRKQTFKEQFFAWPNNRAPLIRYVQKHSPKHNVWFGVNLLINPKRIKEHCVPCNVLWADLDTCDPNDITPRPQCVIESSPKRYQAIWRFDEKLDPYAAEQLSKRIAYAYSHNGADPSGWDLTQLLRVPHTFNYKYDASPRVELTHAYETLAPLAALGGLPELAVTEAEYDLAIPADLPTADDVIKKYWPLLNRTAFAILNGEEPEHDWSRVLWRLINICIESGMTDEETFAVALEAKCNKYARDDRPVSHLWREVQRARQSQDKIAKLVGTHSPLTIPELLTEQELRRLPRTLIDDYHDWAVASTDAVPAFHDLTFFMVLSTLLAGGIKINTTYGMLQPNLWGLVLGDSTLTRKTTAMRMGMSFIEEIDGKRLLASDASAEGLLSGLADRPNLVSVFFRDEVSGFFDSIKTKQYMSSMPELMAQLYDIPPILPRKLRKETITVTAPVFIFFGGGIKDKTYSLISEQLILSGFIPRFLVVGGEANMETIRRTGPVIVSNIEKRGEIAQELHKLYDVYNTSGEFQLAGQKVMELPQSVEALLSQGAWERYGDIEMAMARSANDAVISHLALPTYERASRSLLKMAMLIAAVRREPSNFVLEVIEEDVMIAAKYIQAWLPHTVDLLSNAGRTTTMRLLDNVMAAIRKEPGILRGKIMQHYHLVRREMDEVQNTLEDRGQIRIERKGKAQYLHPID